MSTPDVIGHYGGSNLVETLKAAFAAADIDENRLTLAELAPLDQFHTRGLAGTMELAAALDLQADHKVLDVGSGLGGPSRFLASTYGCHVTGIDLTPAYVEAASFLAQRTGLAERVDYQTGNALDLPFPEGSFDVVWTQHVAMNIADRQGLYQQMLRVLKPGGRLAIYDIIAREGQAPIYPLPWARSEAASFLLTEQEMTAALNGAGFDILSSTDDTTKAIDWFAQIKASDGLRSPLGLGLTMVMGADWPVMTGNLARCLGEGRLGLRQIVATRR